MPPRPGNTRSGSSADNGSIRIDTSSDVGAGAEGKDTIKDEPEDTQQATVRPPNEAESENARLWRVLGRAPIATQPQTDFTSATIRPRTDTAPANATETLESNTPAEAGEEETETDRLRRMLQQIDDEAQNDRDTYSENHSPTSTGASQSDRSVLRILLGSAYESPDSQGRMPVSPGAAPNRRAPQRHLTNLPGYPSADVPTPPGLSLRDRVRQYPNHLEGENLDPFIGVWSARQIGDALPHQVRSDVTRDTRDCSFMMSPLRRRIRELRREGRYETTIEANRRQEGVPSNVPVPQQYQRYLE